MVSETRVTRRFQVTIPREIREKIGIRIGDRLRVKVDNGRIVMEPVLKRVSDPVGELLKIYSEPIGVDAVKLVEESWDED